MKLRSNSSLQQMLLPQSPCLICSCFALVALFPRLAEMGIIRNGIALDMQSI